SVIITFPVASTLTWVSLLLSTFTTGAKMYLPLPVTWRDLSAKTSMCTLAVLSAVTMTVVFNFSSPEGSFASLVLPSFIFTTTESTVSFTWSYTPSDTFISANNSVSLLTFKVRRLKLFGSAETSTQPLAALCISTLLIFIVTSLTAPMLAAASVTEKTTRPSVILCVSPVWSLPLL